MNYSFFFLILQKQTNKQQQQQTNSKRLGRVQKKMVARFYRCCCLFGKPGHVVRSLDPWGQTTELERLSSSVGQTDNHCGLVRAPLSPEGLRRLVPVNAAKDGTPAPFSSSWHWQCHCPHSCNSSQLSPWRRRAAAAAPTVLARARSLRLLFTPRS